MRLRDLSFDDMTLAGAPVASWVQAAAVGLRRQAQAEWYGSSLHLLLLARGRPEGVGVAPRDFRPVRPGAAQDLKDGFYTLANQTLEVGAGGDPWDRPSPSRRFAVELHQWGWLHELLAGPGPGAEGEALRLVLEWERLFGRWSPFPWEAKVLERRVFNHACLLKRITEGASDAERNRLALSLARQARHLSGLWGRLDRAAERAAAVGVAGTALAGAAGEALVARAIQRLSQVLPLTVLPDGGHASRAPEAGLQLLFSLLTFDDALLQMGREPPPEVARAIDRLTAAQRFFTLPDGLLACFQGGEEGRRADVEAARAHDDGGPAPLHAPHSGYEKMIGGALHIIVDAARPAAGAWSVAACAQPLALEVVCGRDRLITNCGWSPRAEAAQPLRLTPAGSTASLAGGSAGAPLRGAPAQMLGPRLHGGADTVEVRRHEAPEGVWLELSHDGWARRYGMTHERRLYLDIPGEELRGEDRMVSVGGRADRMLPFDVRFHLHPDVRVSLARDQRSVLIQGPTAGGWWLRNDAVEVAIEPSTQLLDGHPRRTSQVLLRTHVRADRGGRIRWKLARVGPENP